MSTKSNNEGCCSKSMQERLAHVGAKIDQLIERADEAKETLSKKEEEARHRSEEALDEIKQGLDHAWQELNQAWHEIRESGQRAAAKLHPEKTSGCQSQCKDAEATAPKGN